MLVSFGMMAVSSMVAASADLHASSSDAEKHAETVTGYLWMISNCLSSAMFVVFMRYTIKKSGPNVKPFKDFDTVLFNNALTAPVFILMSLAGADGNLKEFVQYYGAQENADERFQLIMSLIFSGISAFWISYASAWCVRVTNSTTYSMVGALNKLPIALAGLVLFPGTNFSITSLFSIFIGFASGIIYTIAKLRYDASEPPKTFRPPTPEEKPLHSA
jgi:GDP-mannose transporter